MNPRYLVFLIASILLSLTFLSGCDNEDVIGAEDWVSTEIYIQAAPEASVQEKTTAAWLIVRNGNQKVVNIQQLLPSGDRQFKANSIHLLRGDYIFLVEWFDENGFLRWYQFIPKCRFDVKKPALCETFQWVGY